VIVAAVVPTLNRRRDLARCLATVASQTRPPDRVFVVDNGSTDGTRELLAADEAVTTALVDENLGAPGGFARGMEDAFGAGADWAWLMDDDAEADPDALERLLERTRDDAGGRVGGAAPTLELGDGARHAGWRWGSRASGGSGQSPIDPDSGDAPTDVDWAPFAGLLVSRPAWESTGPIRRDFFLWHADVEYCLRLRARGWRLLSAPRARVRHPALPTIDAAIAGRALAVGDIPPWREYYDTRNRAILLHDLRGTRQSYGVPLLRRAWNEVRRDAAVVALDRRAGLRRVSMRMLGLLDGARSYMARHPERR
jgi:GT2 family glycosyltransferase